MKIIDLETLAFLQKESAKAEQDNSTVIFYKKNLNFNK